MSVLIGSIVKIYLDRPHAEREHFKILLNEANRRNAVLSERGDHEYIWVVRNGAVIKVRNKSFGKQAI